MKIERMTKAELIVLIGKLQKQRTTLRKKVKKLEAEAGVVWKNRVAVDRAGARWELVPCPNT